MNGEKARIPESLSEGKTYLWLKGLPGKNAEYQEVIFLNYRPHPGEVSISCNGKLKIIHRRCLHQLNGPGFD